MAMRVKALSWTVVDVAVSLPPTVLRNYIPSSSPTITRSIRGLTWHSAITVYVIVAVAGVTVKQRIDAA